MHRKYWIAIVALFAVQVLTLALLLPIVVRAMPTTEEASTAGAPALVSYQGYLTNSTGNPINTPTNLQFSLYKTASGGTAVWQQPSASISVLEGYFNVQLAIGAEVFSNSGCGSDCWLEVTLAGSGTSLPRQRIASVPYALQAASAQWSGLSGVPTGFADGIDAGQYQNVRTVAKNCSDDDNDDCYLTITKALDSIKGLPSDANRYLISIFPGTYTETVTLPSYVILSGVHPFLVVITSGGSAQADRGTITLEKNTVKARFYNLSIRNTGGAAYAISVYADEGSSDLVFDRVNTFSGGGTYNYGIYTKSTGTINYNHGNLKVDGDNIADMLYGIYNYNSTGATTIYNAQISFGGTAAQFYGLYNEGGIGALNVQQSVITGANTHTVFSNIPNANIWVERSRLGGGPVSPQSGTNVHCVFVNDEAFAAFPNACP